MIGNIDWSKAPEGATHYRADNDLYYMKGCDDSWSWFDDRTTRWESSVDFKRWSVTEHDLTPRPTEPKSYTRDEALKFLAEQLDSWPTDIADAPLCQGWGWKMVEATISFMSLSDGTIWEPQWQVACTEFDPLVSVEDAQPATAKQPAPSGKGSPILGMVLADLTNRALDGKEKYGEPLKANNGRNALWDAYQEALDLAMYLRQAIAEQELK